MIADSDDPDVLALQAALAGEHAAVYAYAAIAGRGDAGSSVVELANEAYAAHRAGRDRLVRTIAARGEAPVPTEPGYALPFALEGPGAARRLARLVEDRCGVLHAAVVAAASGQERALGAQELVECALRGVQWGADATAFPGVKESR
jgi:hypothetical protein